MLEVSVKSKIYPFLEQSDASVLYISADALHADCFSDLSNGTDCIIVDMQNQDILLSPYAPFLSILRNFTPSEEIICQSVYSLHQGAFRGYFQNGLAESRTDVIIPCELDYEKKRMTRNIVVLLKKLVHKPIIILNAQFLSPEAIEVIESVDGSSSMIASNYCGIKLIVCFNATEVSLSGDLAVQYNQLRFNHQFHTITQEPRTNTDTNQIRADVVDVTAIPFTRLEDALWNFRYFLSLSQLKQITKKIIAVLSNLDISADQNRTLYLEAGISSFYTGNTDKALFYFDTVISGNSDDYQGKRALFFMTQVLVQKNDFDAADKYAMMLYQKTENDDAHRLHTLAAAIHYIINASTSRTRTIDDYRKIQHLLADKSIPNNAIYTLLFIPFYINPSAAIVGQLKTEIDVIINTAESLDNEIQLSSAYHWKGVLLSIDGDKNSAEDYYLKSNNLRIKLGGMLQVIKIKNGIAYEKMLSGDYAEAFNLINDCLPRINELNDIPEIILTIFNLGRILFFGRNFKQALDVFLKIFAMMRLFNITEFLYFTVDDLYLFCALIQCLNNDVLQSRFTYEKIIKQQDRLSIASKPLLEFLGVLLDANYGNMMEALGRFEKVRHMYQTEYSIQKNEWSFVCFEYATLLERMGFTKESKQLYNFALNDSAEKKLAVYMESHFPSSPDQYQCFCMPFSALKLDFCHIEEMAVKEHLVNSLHKTIRDTRFLNKILDLASRYSVKEEFVHHSILTICECFLCDFAYIAEKDGNNWIPLASYTSDGMPPNAIPDGDQILQTNTGSTLFTYNEQERTVLYNISKFEFTGIAFLLLDKEEHLSVEDINLLKLALSSLQGQITMFKQNENLRKLSSTDQLTTLHNRHALNEKIDKDSDMVRRYYKRDKVIFQITITFFDLDNFKHYNDTYGHEAGDLLIALFGRLLARVYRKIDFVARYGGDEFVVVLPATPPDGALLAVERLRRALVEEDFFKPQLEQLVQHSLQIAESQLLGFSAGICTNYRNDAVVGLENVLCCADKALYKAKTLGKNNSVIWTDQVDTSKDAIMFDNSCGTKNPVTIDGGSGSQNCID